MFITMVVVFILGYTAIALEHPLKIDKAASALLTGVVLWVIFVFGGEHILNLEFSPSWEHWLHSTNFQDFMTKNPDAGFHEQVIYFITHHELYHHLAEISRILFFLLGAMTIVEIVDQHQGFKVITDKIKTTNKVKLLWILSILTFFMSAALDNLTTTIVMIALLRKLISDKKTRWFFASMIVLAANAGGAWSPIGDVTTIMLWIGGQVTAVNIITQLIVPSMFTTIVPLVVLSFIMKGDVKRPDYDPLEDSDFTTPGQRVFILILGVSSLLFVPVFKTVTHLDPYMGMLFGLGVMWVTTEVMHKKKKGADKRQLTVVGILTRVDVPTVLFFLGILTAVSSLASAGQLQLLAGWLDEKLGNIYAINLAIGILSAIVDNVPLVAGAMGMYPTVSPEFLETLPAANQAYQALFIQDGPFWEFLAYCAGTGGSILIIGSAAGVAAMGMEKIDFIWYMKRISLLALLGYFAGALVYYLQITYL
ncbi:MAG: sodium:proton antiporter NhaD [Bacteroidales bacterium]|nr:sodium:proton antiporter NhaD [Bacteroidales bacterium]MCF8343416.1 sodium:proton antiporter NhaD [Bacteroidales bacterium]MCF8349856.1 sodium:proton antiporter NhaD [Bacteroidales bacterium]MCF8375548.1 sodium:proton antiporter NhaD [Bacteroidales bacterium]MCF8399947.1 sodium:proton antiporter NhaD [Bacteroidales bacterium]